MKKPLIFAISFLFAFGVPLKSQASGWEPSPGHTQIPIWPGKVPDAKPVPGPETATTSKDLIAGKPIVCTTNVSKPTITVYSPPAEKNTGAAIIVFPGGGYQILAMDLEGTEICDEFTAKGITCVLLKYRVPSRGSYPRSPMALEDAQRAVSLVRYRAKEWNINPNKIGVLGFSAGGHLSVAASIYFNKRLYNPVDAADKVSCRPDFAVPIYPGHLTERGNLTVLNPAIVVPKQTPPTLLIQAQDDPVDPVEHSLRYYEALRKAKIPTEMHLYAHGGHAFGLRRSKFPITEWPDLVTKWLETIKITNKTADSVVSR